MNTFDVEETQGLLRTVVFAPSSMGVSHSATIGSRVFHESELFVSGHWRCG